MATANVVMHCRNQVVKVSFGNITLKLNIFNICMQLSTDTEEVQDVNFIEEVCEDHDIIPLCISDLLEMTLLTNMEFLNKFKLDNAIQFANHMNNAYCMYVI